MLLFTILLQLSLVFSLAIETSTITKLTTTSTRTRTRRNPTKTKSAKASRSIGRRINSSSRLSSTISIRTNPLPQPTQFPTDADASIVFGKVTLFASATLTEAISLITELPEDVREINTDSSTDTGETNEDDPENTQMPIQAESQLGSQTQPSEKVTTFDLKIPLIVIGSLAFCFFLFQFVGVRYFGRPKHVII